MLFEPTSVPKSAKLLKALEGIQEKPVIYITPNGDEALAMSKLLPHSDSTKLPELNKIPLDILQAASKLISAVDKVILKMGPKGVVLLQRESQKVDWRWIQPAQVLDHVESVTGAGDSMVGSLITGLSRMESLPNASQMEALVKASMQASALSIASPRAVSESLSPAIFSQIPWLTMK